MGQTKVLLDTNILISALGWNGKPRRIFKKCLSEELELISSPEQIEESRRVMNYPKLNFTEEQKRLFLEIFTAKAIIVNIPKKIKVIREDPDDDLILETAIIGDAEYIVSGDPHILKLKEYANIKIVTANDFLTHR